MTRIAMGLALGNGRAIASWQGPSGGAHRTEPFSFDANALAEGDVSALSALTALRRTAPTLRTLHVALGAPWTSPRMVTLPPLRAHEARRALSRDAARWFPHASSRTSVAVYRVDDTTWFAADASDAVLDAIAGAAKQAGFGAVRIVPAVAALAAVADAASTAFVMDDEAAVIGAQGGRITSLRRCRPADLPPGVRVHADGLALAAAHAERADVSEFVSAQTAAARGAMAWRASRQLVVLSAIAITVALAVRVWGASHRVAQLQARRAALHPVVAPFLATRDSLSAITEAAALLADAGRTSWTQRLRTVSAALPRGVTITALSGDADSLRLEGNAPDAAAALAQLRRAPGVARVDDRSVGANADAAFSVVVVFRAERAP